MKYEPVHLKLLPFTAGGLGSHFRKSPCQGTSKDLKPHLKERALEFDFLLESDGQYRWHLD